VAGGDTASALAAGNPVVVKAHPAHPGASDIAARAVRQAVSACGLPRGTFGLLHGASAEVSLALVVHPMIRAVGFTGSLAAGRALFDAAAARPEPIPVYAEMGSVNPVLVLPEALRERGAAIAAGLLQSATLGVGQFCTNPGVVLGLHDDALMAFVAEAGRLASAMPAGVMLQPRLADRFRAGRDAFRGTAGVEVAGEGAPGSGASSVAPIVFFVSGAAFLRDSSLREELFGPSTLVVACADRKQLGDAVRSLPGQLTASVHATEGDLRQYQPLIDALAERVGRVVFGGFPTGVEVAPAMHHGGPYPATTDVRSTSVGTASIQRFARPVCYQSAPASLLPPELQDANPRGLWRLVDGELSRAGW